ncbi:MAG: thiamine pyrophosphate-dependent enzyme [Alphaproteobacteria bacterium]|nr:thiamine pyrophosphate-dependent enzyme [Alphaproteobacteria bacterium]
MTPRDRAGGKTLNLDRREVVARLLADAGDLLVITGLGSSTWDCATVMDRDLNFYLRGAMGSASSIGLGLALAQPQRRVLVITGDAEIMMTAGALATIGAQGPKNLSIVVLDNECYGETGMQPSLTAFGADLGAMAAAAGFKLAETIWDEAALTRVLPAILGRDGPALHAVKVKAENYPHAMPPGDGTTLKDRFRQALLGPDAMA